MTPARQRGRLRPAYAVAVLLVKPFMMVATKQDWRGWEHLPGEGGFIVTPNHISYFDPFPVSHFLFDSGCPPFFLGKESVFRIPVFGRLLKAAGQIPVHRMTGRAVDAYRSAVAGVHEGKCVVMFPEGTLTRDPGQWPMTGKTGAARVALETRCPIVPMGHWGAQDVIAPYGKRLRLLPRKTMHVVLGPPVDLSDLYDQPIDATSLREATERVMAGITALVEQLRGSSAPAERYDPRAHGDPEIGNPHQEPL
ncbi:MAG: 1-acyl-sn-glycerol-3-phosphate acyltransferase [Actinomycetota bacterium]|nr:1-acyl-sn-glycerol-3-phosphate acyltransferase [Actinomycetota bacterium]